MSELQLALLAIGLGVVVAVYLYGWWKQRQYSRKFGAAFHHNHDDALYRGQDARTANPEAPAEEVAAEWVPLVTDELTVVNQDAEPLAAVADESVSADLPDATVQAAEAEAEATEAIAVKPVATPAVSLNDSCSLLDARSDFIIELQPELANSPAALDGLWQRKFDFRKPVQVCGLRLADGQWERVIADSQTLYSRFRIALQLVDRGGVISMAKLADFRDLLLGIAKTINADAAVPDIQATHLVAQALDAFCADVDRMVGINLLPGANRQLNGRRISAAAALQGMRLESDGAFHLLNAQGNSLVTLINKDSKPFQHLTLDHFTTPALTLLLDAPRVERPAEVFDLMLSIARALGQELQLNLVDDHNVLLTDAGLANIRTQIAEVEVKMRENTLMPGGAQALRLFS
ncbi:MAG: cell division protein ZipA C-terminal FtsZ-binding domain-containing protein [Gallionella sp.]|nr:cell division protein ZipA C-terminal FtsZ-binding domain-containing protein [Gallionella sp.]